MMAGGNFFQTLKGYDKENVSEKILTALGKFINKTPELENESLKSAGKVALSLGKWAKAIVNYCKIAKNVEPLRQKVAILNKELEES
jgi:hypothetical protein